MRISDWSSDVCSSDLEPKGAEIKRRLGQAEIVLGRIAKHVRTAAQGFLDHVQRIAEAGIVRRQKAQVQKLEQAGVDVVAAEGGRQAAVAVARGAAFYRRPDRVGAILPEGLPILQPQRARRIRRSEEHTSELQSLMRI